MNFVKHYVRANMMQRATAKDIMEEFSNELAMIRGKCIDIGSGPGDITKELLLPRLQPDVIVVGSDISQYMTDYGNINYAEDKRLSFIVLDIETTELSSEENGQYDFAVSFSCLHWCQDMRRVFGNIYKLLRPNGRALVEFIAHHGAFECYYKLKRNAQYEPYMQDVDRYIPYFQNCKNPRESLRKILDNTGFKIIHCSQREATFTFESKEILREHILAVNPFVSRMPDDIKDKFIDDLTEDIILHQIVRPHKMKQQTQEPENQTITLDRYYTLLVYVKRPRSAPLCIKCNTNI
ncbi:PREDICTED: juvenile hormone acid O-methyltransferase-like [Dinoponera quadriceps]|uniref:Juvenile hormone acid O-methyltransferase-like n=1 Tax=Dinoponera quadriceps TaxID=609295 RepID=A0A6P3X0T5_DINQU|nr:PREDICTED: juvenile hormone acid O-methyltransferase-like [Dinoponera quadriceps]